MTDDLHSSRKKKKGKSKDDGDLSDSFEKSIIELQRSKLNLDLRMHEEKIKNDDLEHKANVMRKAKELLNEGFTEKQIMAMIPESKPMFD